MAKRDFKEGDYVYVQLGSQLVRGIVMRVRKNKIDVGHYCREQVPRVRMGGPDEPEWVDEIDEIKYKKISTVPRKKVFTLHEF